MTHAPAQLLRRHEHALGNFIEQQFEASPGTARRAIRHLGHADHTLRRCRIPNLTYQVARRFDPTLPARFDFFLDATRERLPQIHALLGGAEPSWSAAPPSPRLEGDLSSLRAAQEIHLVLPDDLFAVRAASICL